MVSLVISGVREMDIVILDIIFSEQNEEVRSVSESLEFFWVCFQRRGDVEFAGFKSAFKSRLATCI